MILSSFLFQYTNFTDMLIKISPTKLLSKIKDKKLYLAVIFDWDCMITKKCIVLFKNRTRIQNKAKKAALQPLRSYLGVLLAWTGLAIFRLFIYDLLFPHNYLDWWAVENFVSCVWVSERECGGLSRRRLHRWVTPARGSLRYKYKRGWHLLVLDLQSRNTTTLLFHVIRNIRIKASLKCATCHIKCS